MLHTAALRHALELIRALCELCVSETKTPCLKFHIMFAYLYEHCE